MAGLPGFLRTRKFWLAAAAIAVVAVLGMGAALFRAARGLQKAENDAVRDDIPFHTARLDRHATPFEPISAPAVFRDAALFNGNLYLCGPAGLIEYDAAGTLRARAFQRAPRLHGHAVGHGTPVAQYE